MPHLPQAGIDATICGLNLVTALRDFHGYTAEQLSIASGLTLNEIELLENQPTMTASHATRLARVFGQPESIFVQPLKAQP